MDGQPPFSDQSLVELERGDRTLLSSERAAAVVSTDEVELVVDPDHRGHGHGTSLATAVLQEHPGVTYAWAHGDHPGSRALARRFDFVPVRTLLQLQADVGEQISDLDSRIRSFQPGHDDFAWLALNAKAFAEHPEQGRLTQRDLDDRIAEDWFDADDFLLLDDHGELIGFCWLKVEADSGEFYAVGIDPARQGEGLGRVLMDAGFARLDERDIRLASLYVEADNEPALALYERYGFTQHTIDIRYQRTAG
jgi:mycothiol synthase